MAEVEVPKDVLQSIFVRVLTESVAPELQRKVFADAMTSHLFSEDRNGRSVLREAFTRALNDVMSSVAKEVVESHRAEIVAFINDSFTKALVDPATSKNLIDRFVSAASTRGW